MSLKDYETRLYVKDDLSIGKSLVLKNDQSHYIRSVLRLKENSQIALFNGEEGEWLSTIKIISKKFVELEVIEQIKSKGYFVNNIDINIITQTPKIKNYKNKMINNIAKLCEISKGQINIKGKTTEKLGVIGKEKAIACEVICSVIKYD